MARLKITDMKSFGLTAPITATDWEVYDKINPDGSFGTLLFRSLDNKEFKTSISATLKNPDGTLYDVEQGSVGRVRVRVDDQYSNWLLLPVCN